MPRLYDPNASLEALNTLSGLSARGRNSESAQMVEKIPVPRLFFWRDCDPEKDPYKEAKSGDCDWYMYAGCRGKLGKLEVNQCDGKCYCHLPEGKHVPMTKV